jgi:hypothetical protein
MGYIDIQECVFTGQKAKAIIDSIAATEYFVTINGKEHLIRYSNLQKEDPFILENKNLFIGLLYNDDWFEDEQKFITLKDLKDLIAGKILPQTPEHKLTSLFLKLFSSQKEDGEWVAMDEVIYDEVLWRILYFKSVNELDYYIGVLQSKGLINAAVDNTKYRPGKLQKYRITYEGLNYELKLKAEGNQSNKCFIAMSFKNETDNIRKAIKEALKSTGFEPLIVDEQNIESDRTINDEIIANLKRCKFCIADFTFHSLGVYFESGHALGQGKKVIYTCRQDEFEKAHFDIRPLQHIIYQTPEQLTKDLINKIEAWIK